MFNIKEKAGKWRKDHISELSKNNFAVFEIVQKEIIENEILPENKWIKVEENRPDITRYLASNPGKELFGEKPWMVKKEKGKTEEPKIISSATEEDFKKAKAEKYKGK